MCIHAREHISQLLEGGREFNYNVGRYHASVRTSLMRDCMAGTAVVVELLLVLSASVYSSCEEKKKTNYQMQ